MEKILTPFLEIDIIELGKAIKEYPNNTSDEVLQWMMFLDNPENGEVKKIMETNKDIKEAKEELDKISQDDILRRMDQNQRMYEARRDGREEGKIEGKLEVAKKMLAEGLSIEMIMRITDLKKEEIASISQN